MRYEDTRKHPVYEVIKTVLKNNFEILVFGPLCFIFCYLIILNLHHLYYKCTFMQWEFIFHTCSFVLHDFMILMMACFISIAATSTD